MTRFALYSRFEDKDGLLILRTEYFSVQAGDAAIAAGWDLIGEEPHPLDDGLTEHIAEETRKWDRRAR